ncbi:MAG TPA: hypothetical protein VJ962_04295 [Clostridia bacterium]|nr:hypothetical protein [Clostridia bacterium]
MKFPKWWDKSGIRSIGHPIIDHCIVEKRKDGLIQVHSRPYKFSMDLLWKLMIQCKAFGIDFRISGETTYSNKDTLTITFWKFQDEKNIKEYEMFKDVM